MKFLIIEDDKRLTQILKETFLEMGESDIALDGESGLEKATTSTYDIIILDLMLPNINGEEVLSKLRKIKNTPVIVLSAVASHEKRVELLEKGADDYVVKPFYREELIARIKATLRRYNKNFFDLSYTFGGLKIDFISKKVLYNEKELPIVGKVYDMLEYLVKNKEITITKEQLFDHLCGFYSETIDKVIDVYAYRLRKALNEDNIGSCLKTIKTVGYVWTEKT